MNEMFTRTISLIGEEAFSRLASSSVAVFGLGGVGSHCAEALARSGIGHLYLADADRIAASNINRQSIALLSTVGREKTEVMREKIADINPGCTVTTSTEFLLPDNINQVFSSFEGKPDYIIDAIDTVSAKLALAEYAYRHQIPALSSMGTGNKLCPERFRFADIYDTQVCPLCRVMRRELKKRGIPALRVLYSEETPVICETPAEAKTSGRPAPASISFVPPVAGLLLAGEAVRHLAGIRY
ncbi:MAG: tRNA threonylcarbamoyladenosine dehydratase [Lachnospiraceae bacterium]|jgi:tRNA A37 threonylcarbamoyladenosine dehydratase|nr:tRNA threonylcarbamoyladenosine dehydratase [Lachnospiraceae bacterium]NBJ82078.1 tRNA threonylcarbamoyladenosine dehydratase [bacterium 1XD42-76]NBK05358.1 tRNA threonylcarbamoyladenosine dehydratase [bacterium 1XD42-94]